MPEHLDAERLGLLLHRRDLLVGGSHIEVRIEELDAMQPELVGRGQCVVDLEITLRDFKIDDALAATNKLGLHGIEFFNAHFNVTSTDEQIAAMKKKTESLGIKMLGHGVNPMTKNHEANRKWFEFAKKAGIKNISADPTED